MAAFRGQIALLPCEPVRAGEFARHRQERAISLIKHAVTTRKCHVQEGCFQDFDISEVLIGMLAKSLAHTSPFEFEVRAILLVNHPVHVRQLATIAKTLWPWL